MRSPPPNSGKMPTPRNVTLVLFRFLTRKKIFFPSKTELLCTADYPVSEVLHYRKPKYLQTGKQSVHIAALAVVTRKRSVDIENWQESCFSLAKRFTTLSLPNDSKISPVHHELDLQWSNNVICPICPKPNWPKLNKYAQSQWCSNVTCGCHHGRGQVHMITGVALLDKIVINLFRRLSFL